MNLSDLMGELFLPCEMPEAPKAGFFTGLFGGGVRSLDREELCKSINSAAMFAFRSNHFTIPSVNFAALVCCLTVGESATGKAGRSVARVIPGTGANLELLGAKATGVAAEVMKTRLALNERGEKLGVLEERTQRLQNEAEAFSNAAHQLMVRYRDKRWYQL